MRSAEGLVDCCRLNRQRFQFADPFLLFLECRAIRNVFGEAAQSLSFFLQATPLRREVCLGFVL